MTKPQLHLANQSRELICDAVQWLKQGHRVAMLTLVNIEGNAPYPVGSQMLVRDDGEFLGQITGGCAETALVQQALSAIATSENTVQRYGLNSPFFDIQLPCGSGLDIEFDVKSGMQFYEEIESALADRNEVKISDVKTYYPNLRLLLFGQGPILDSLTTLATSTGFEVMHFDNDKSYDVQSFCDNYTALVSLFHEHDLEISTLFSALETDLFYIGALGSQRTQAKRLAQLRELGASSESVQKIHGPVGLDIGAITPSQIAVSILAQIVSVVNAHER